MVTNHSQRKWHRKPKNNRGYQYSYIASYMHHFTLTTGCTIRHFLLFAHPIDLMQSIQFHYFEKYHGYQVNSGCSQPTRTHADLFPNPAEISINEYCTRKIIPIGPSVISQPNIQLRTCLRSKTENGEAVKRIVFKYSNKTFRENLWQKWKVKVQKRYTPNVNKHNSCDKIFSCGKVLNKFLICLIIFI